MPCYKPLTAFNSPGGSITFDRTKSFGTEITLPCGRCLGCRLERAKEWALRCTHEASLYDNGLNNSFITCTYRDADLPAHGNLKKSDFQKFIKRLRKNSKQKIRYYMCGEYGDDTCRPHYHAILFGFSFKDRKLVNIRNGNRVYTSKYLDQNWQLGSCEIGSVTFKSAGYVARYILKKQQGTAEQMFDRYVIIDKATGEMTARHNEYTAMSLGNLCNVCKKKSCKNSNGGIGKKWYEQNYSDCFPHDYCVLPDGRQTSVPGYYRDLLRKSDPTLWEELRTQRIEKSRIKQIDAPPLASQQQCKEALMKTRFKRNQI